MSDYRARLWCRLQDEWAALGGKTRRFNEWYVRLFVFGIFALWVFAMVRSGKDHSYKPGPPPAEAVQAAYDKGQRLVWCNHISNIYHFDGDQWYGNTVDGEYLPEDEAMRQGYRLSYSR